jgi:hypothetical protein
MRGRAGHYGPTPVRPADPHRMNRIQHEDRTRTTASARTHVRECGESTPSSQRRENRRRLSRTRRTSVPPRTCWLSSRDGATARTPGECRRGIERDTRSLTNFSEAARTWRGLRPGSDPTPSSGGLSYVKHVISAMGCRSVPGDHKDFGGLMRPAATLGTPALRSGMHR